MEPTPPGRTPGKPLVIGFVIFCVIFFTAMTILALRLEPAADRFHNPTAPTKKAG
jgi:hypothetical protein